MEKIDSHGKYIPLSDVDSDKLDSTELFRKESGEFVCYYGFMPDPITLHGPVPCLSLSVAFRDKGYAKSNRFIAIENGALVWGYGPNFHREIYHIPEMGVRLPKGTDKYYSVLNRKGEIDRDATVQVFGLLYEDLETLIKSYEEAVGHQRFREGRITFSKTSNNVCDLTAVYIPRNFPYIAFSGSNYLWSHISIFGFYCHLALLMKGGSENSFYKRLYSLGVDEEILSRICNIVEETQGARVFPENKFN